MTNTKENWIRIEAIIFGHKFKIDGEKEKGRKERKMSKNLNSVVASIKYVQVPPHKPFSCFWADKW